MGKQVTIYENLDAKSMFDWRQKDGNPYVNFTRNTNQLLFLNKHKDLRNKMIILEYGCAFADLLSMMKTFNHEHEVHGVEVVKEVAREAEKRLGRGSMFVQSCEEKIPLKSGSVDLISSFDMIEHVEDRKKLNKMFSECNRLLKKDGKCIIVTPNFNWILKIIYVVSGNSWMVDKKFHSNMYTAARLKKEMASELRITKVERGYDLNFIKRMLSWFGIYKHICVIAGKK
ncbi:class I SAM-dependent methyltransferase [Candidatus Woesearchaeota archaeon]|nr:class I SAM-dependent methyltransferase [Candidatus Woesearchaeota archaeon]